MEVKNSLKFIYEIISEYREKHSFKESNTFYSILSVRVTISPF